MAQHWGRINAVMVGVGAAFHCHAGIQRRAPEWMQHHGLEWAYRLVQEPRRLWRRYLFTNIPFMFMGGAQWISSRINGARPAATPPVAAVTHEEALYERNETITGAADVQRVSATLSGR